jgi:hypothetical protein
LREADGALAIATALAARDPDDRNAGRLSSLAHALVGGVRSRRGEAGAAAEAWRRSLEAIEPLARASGTTVLALGDGASGPRQDEAAAVLDKLAATGYENATFSHAVMTGPPRPRAASLGREVPKE